LVLPTPRGPLQLATDAQSAVVVPYRSRSGAYRHYSAVDVLHGRLPQDALRGRIVLLGASAPGLLDRHTTPVGDGFPGLALHASVLSGLMDGTLASVPAYTPALGVLQLLLVALVLLPALPRLSLAGGVALGLALSAALLAADLAAWMQAREAWPLAAPLLLVPALLGLHLLRTYLVERHNVLRLGELFGHYLPPERVRQMSRHPERYTMASRDAELSVLFADVHGFTGIAERLPPEALAALMHEFFSAMTDVVQARGGTLDKYMGDALMAFWGAPIEAGDHAAQAVDAALAMQAALQQLNHRFAARGWPQLAISIGINSGSMVVGDLGSRQRRAYTVLGDAVNLAARLQQLASERGLDLLVSEATRLQLPAELACVDLGTQQLRGRAAAVRVYRVPSVAVNTHPRASALLT
ncbi:adenylate/guanylate cyclase domain-containing protein, partial [Pelomonas sp. KK5]|uniref:adenylate/guanylate cyclase domain-containing protein n=1 Tax=Pelomonas sp. KK5 TaxID=1855730 RepID=UPI0011805011